MVSRPPNRALIAARPSGNLPPGAHWKAEYVHRVVTVVPNSGVRRPVGRGYRNSGRGRIVLGPRAGSGTKI